MKESSISEFNNLLTGHKECKKDHWDKLAQNLVPAAEAVRRH